MKSDRGGEGQSCCSGSYRAEEVSYLCDHLQSARPLSWRDAILAVCTGSISISNYVMSNRTTTRFFLHLMIIVCFGRREKRGRSGQCGWKEKVCTIVLTAKTNCLVPECFSALGFDGILQCWMEHGGIPSRLQSPDAPGSHSHLLQIPSNGLFHLQEMAPAHWPSQTQEEC